MPEVGGPNFCASTKRVGNMWLRRDVYLNVLLSIMSLRPWSRLAPVLAVQLHMRQGTLSTPLADLARL